MCLTFKNSGYICSDYLFILIALFASDLFTMPLWESYNGKIRSKRPRAPISELFDDDSDDNRKQLQLARPKKKTKSSSIVAFCQEDYGDTRSSSNKKQKSTNEPPETDSSNKWEQCMFSDDEREELVKKHDKREERMRGETYCKLCDHGGPASKTAMHREIFEKIMGIMEDNREEHLCMNTVLNRMKQEYDQMIQAPFSERNLPVMQIEMRDLRKHFTRDGGCGVNDLFITNDLIKGNYKVVTDLRKNLRLKNRATGQVHYNWAAVAAYDKLIKHHSTLVRTKNTVLNNSSRGSSGIRMSHKSSSRSACDPKGTAKSEASLYQLGTTEC